MFETNESLAVDGSFPQECVEECSKTSEKIKEQDGMCVKTCGNEYYELFKYKTEKVNNQYKYT